MILKCILNYYKCLTVHSAVHVIHISKTIEVIMKWHMKMYLSLILVGQKNSQKCNIAFNINLINSMFSFHFKQFAIKCPKTFSSQVYSLKVYYFHATMTTTTTKDNNANNNNDCSYYCICYYFYCYYCKIGMCLYGVFQTVWFKSIFPFLF